MKQFFCGLIILVLATLPSATVRGQTPILIPIMGIGPCGTEGTSEISVFYINGVLTSTKDAITNLWALHGQFKRWHASAPPNLQKVCYRLRLKYNPTNGLRDGVETALQRYQINKKDFLFLLRPIFGAVGYDANLIATILGSRADPYVSDLLAISTKYLTKFDFVQQSVIQAHANDYQTEIQQNCRGVLLIPHSQGNLYAHQEYNLLFGTSPPVIALPQMLRIAEVATPDADLPNGTTWETSSTDRVMNTVRLALPDTPNANTNWGYTPIKNVLGHDFITYLNLNPSHDAIFGDIQKQLTAIPKGGCFAFDSHTYTAPSSGGTIPVKVLRKNPAATTVTFATNGGTAVPGVDYVAQQGALTFSSNEMEKTVSLTVLNNPNSKQGDVKTVNLTLTVSGGSPISNAGDSAVLSIVKATEVIGFSSYTGLSGSLSLVGSQSGPATLPAPVTNNKVTIGVDRDCPNCPDIFAQGFDRATVAYSVSDGTAKAGVDYVATSGTLTFPSGPLVPTPSENPVVHQTFDIPFSGGPNAGGKTFFVTLSNPSPASAIIDTNPRGLQATPTTILVKIVPEIQLAGNVGVTCFANNSLSMGPQPWSLVINSDNLNYVSSAPVTTQVTSSTAECDMKASVSVQKTTAFDWKIKFSLGTSASSIGLDHSTAELYITEASGRPLPFVIVGCSLSITNEMTNELYTPFVYAAWGVNPSVTSPPLGCAKNSNNPVKYVPTPPDSWGFGGTLAAGYRFALNARAGVSVAVSPPFPPTLFSSLAGTIDLHIEPF